MSMFSDKELLKIEQRIKEMMTEANNAVTCKCLDKPEVLFRGSDGVESEGPGHSYNSLRARNMAVNLNKISACVAALKRIANGIYGICPNCQGDISKRRLESLPTEPFCIDCKMELDEAKGGIPKVGPRNEVRYIHEI